MNTDLYRQYLDRSFRELLPYVSSETGLLHIHDEMPSQAAPTRENFLYALLLLRRKTHESIRDGRDLLGRLLFFQNRDQTSDQYGNFPVHLTDYPECRDWRLPVFVCEAMTAIRTEFDAVLGSDVQQRLHAAHRLLFQCARKNAEKCSYRSWEAFVMALQEWFLEQLPNSPIESASERFIQERGPLHPDGFGLALAALSYFPPCRTPLIDYARQLFHPQAATYAGPALDVRQCGAEPALTLFDLYMGGKTLLLRHWGCRPALELALITPREPVPAPTIPIAPDPTYPFWSDGSAFVSACLGCQTPSCHPSCHPVRIVTPSCTIALTFPCGFLTSFSRNGTRFLGRIQAAGVTEERPCLLRAYVERKKDVHLLVEGKKASVFSPKEGITIDGGRPIVLALDAPTIRCIGHVSLGNRPNQKLGGESFDWKISLDIVRGNIEDEVKFTIDIGG